MQNPDALQVPTLTGRVGQDLVGTSGDDIIALSGFLQTGGPVTLVDAGAGNDRVSVYTQGLTAPQSYTITLGPGQDWLQYASGAAAIHVTDFQAGDFGDLLDVGALITRSNTQFGSTLQVLLQPLWDGESNPFVNGPLHLVQSGSGSVLQLDQIGAAAIPLIYFDNVLPAQFTPYNLGGFGLDGWMPSPWWQSGSTGPDFIRDSSGDDILWGADGDDVLNGTLGDDTFYGGNGNDIISDAYGGDAIMYGEAGADQLLVNANVNVSETTNSRLDGGAGADHIQFVGWQGTVNPAAVQNLYVDGGDGDDSVEALLVDNAEIHLGAGNDIAYVNVKGAGHITVYGDEGEDTVVFQPTQLQTFAPSQQSYSFISVENIGGSRFSERLTGDSAANKLRGAGGDDVLDGAGGADTADYSDATSAVTVSLAATGPQAVGGGLGSDTLISIENLIGSNFNDRLTGDAGDNRLRGGAGDDILDGGAGVDFADYSDSWAPVTISLAGGSQNGPSGIDSFISIEGLIGMAYDDRLTGDGGANSFIGGGGSDILNGGAGIDTAIYLGLSRSYTRNLTASSNTVSGGAEGGTDSLISIERIKFVDGYLAIGTTDTAARVYRVYEAALGRSPDPNGLANWVAALEKGTPLLTIGDGFLNSPEFIGRFGAGDNAAFVNLLYQNVLGRPADQAGLDAWVAAINAGHSRSEVLTGFSESPEFIASTAAAVQHGLWVGDANAAKVARLYDTVFDRSPDASGETAWTGALQRGETLQTVANGFVGSIEFQATYGALTDNQFVNQLYQNVLGRPADEGGLTAWTNFLASGRSRAEVVVGFSESDEHVANLAPRIDDGVWFG